MYACVETELPGARVEGIKHHDKKTYGEVAVCVHAFVTLTLERGGQIASRHGDLIPSDSCRFIHQTEN
jgi:hypothetical protein